MGPSLRPSPITCRANAEEFWRQRSYALFNFSFSAITSFTLILSLYFHILLCSCTERWEKFPHIISSVLLASGSPFFFFLFAEAGSHFISLIIFLSTTSHEGISNKYFLPFVVGLFFRSASYSRIFYIPSASLPCKVQQWLYNKFLWDPVSDIKLSFWIGKPIDIFHPNNPPSRVMGLSELRVTRIELRDLSDE